MAGAGAAGLFRRRLRAAAGCRTRRRLRPGADHAEEFVGNLPEGSVSDAELEVPMIGEKSNAT